MRRYVFQDGFDSDQCGQTVETACKTMNPILEQLHTMHSFVSQDLLDQVEDVWRNVLDEFQSWENVVPAEPTFSTSIPTVPWDTRYVFENDSDLM